MSRDLVPVGPFGVIAEYETPEQILEAGKAASAAGFTRMEAYSPLPVEGLAEAIGFERNWMPQIVFAGGLLGGVAGYVMQWFATVVHYPINVGGRPFHSWPMYLPITFEMTVLGAAFAAVFGMLGINGLPKPYHPVFAVPGFEHASTDRFFLMILAIDPKFSPEAARDFLATTNPLHVHDVAH